MKINTKNLKWTRTPKQYIISEDKIEIITEPHTDLWQRTYYHPDHIGLVSELMKQGVKLLVIDTQCSNARIVYYWYWIMVYVL